jgi:uncharacterized protein
MKTGSVTLMRFSKFVLPSVAALAFSGLALTSAKAQEISESHLNAARAAIAATDATDQFDNILPNAAELLRAELLRKDPNLLDQINTVVTDKTIVLAGRRADLETEAARVYARVFTEDELKAIAAFYETPAGKKLLSDGPIVIRELIKAANIWQEGIARDLAVEVGTELRALVPASPAAADGAATPAPASGG